MDRTNSDLMRRLRSLDPAAAPHHQIDADLLLSRILTSPETGPGKKSVSPRIILIAGAIAVLSVPAFAFATQQWRGLDEPAPPSVTQELGSPDARAIARLTTSTGHGATLYSATNQEGACTYVRTTDHARPAGIASCRPNAGDDRPITQLTQTSSRTANGQLRFAFGKVHASVVVLEIHFSDGRVSAAPLSAGFFLIEVPKLEETSATLVAKDERGNVIDRRPLETI